jgi:predicted Zn-dependent peptidase
MPLNPNRPAPGQPREYHFPPFSHRTLDNGLTVWVVPLPGRAMVSVSLIVDGGAATETEEQGGIAALTAQSLVTGTQRLDANDFAIASEQLGIEIGADSAWDSARAAFSALAPRLEDGLGLLGEMVRQPRFDEEEFTRLREERLADIMQARAEPGRLADEQYLAQLFGPDSPYGRLSAGTPETVEPLTVSDARAHHTRTWGPAGGHLVFAGPIDPERAFQLAASEFGSWSGGGAGHRSIAVEREPRRRVVLYDRPGSVQSEIRVGEIGIARTDPNYFPAVVMAGVLGGTFSSRLNQKLREELGYTYGARAGFDPRRSRGPMASRAAVQTEVTAPSVVELLAVLESMRSAPPADAELADVRDYMVGVFPLRFETTHGVAGAIEPIAVYDLATDWWATYRDHIENVSPEQVHDSARELIHPDTALILLVGDAATVEPALVEAGLGPVETISAD